MVNIIAILFSCTQLRELALANVGSIHRRVDLSNKLSKLTEQELRDLVCSKVSQVDYLYSMFTELVVSNEFMTFC